MNDLILADFKTKTWISDRKRKEQDLQRHLQRQGEALILHALQGAPRVPLGQEPVIPIDTSCSEMNPDQTA
jgi:hypothetical protein